MKKYIVIWLIVTVLINMLLSQTLASAKPAGWSEDINLTQDDDKDSRRPSISVYEDKVHVIWMDQRHYPITNAPEIYYKNSTDGGNIWNPELRLTFNESSKNYPRMALDGDNIHIVWHDSREGGGNKIYYKNSTNGGNTWSADKSISQSFGEEGDIAVNGNKLHVVYYNNWQINYINSTDNGITWSEPQILTETIRDSFAPGIAVNGSNVHIVWTDHYDRFGNPTMGAIFYLNSSDDGLTWSEDFNLTPMNLDADYPDIAVDGDNVHVTYCEERSGLWQIYYRRSEDNGVTWIEEFTMSNSPDDLFINTVKVKQNAIYTLWLDTKDPMAEVYLRNSSDNGQNWYDETRMTYDPAFCGYSDIAIENESLHLVWSDWRDGAPEIYYKHYPVPSSPTNLTIDIQGTTIILNWTAPQNSPSPVDHYLIYRSTTWDGFDFSSPWIDTSIHFDNGIIPLRTSWNHTGAADPGNMEYSEQWYYCVRAIDTEGWNDTNTNIVGKYAIPLNAGWNLISLPLAQDNTIISEVLKSIDGNYNIVHCYDAKDKIWNSSQAGLTNINRTMGLWIHMKNKCNLSVVGAVPESTDIALYEGWNLIGYPSLKTRDLSDALNGISWTTVWTYDVFDIGDFWKVNNTSKPTQLNDLEEMKPSCGYWVYVTINDTWVRTRVGEDNKVVVWRVHGIEEKVSNQYSYEPIIESPPKPEKEDNSQFDIVPEEPIDNDNRIDFSVIFLIVLIAFVFVELRLLYKIKHKLG